MTLVKVDFTGYESLHQCPAWWRGFVKHTTHGILNSRYKSDCIDTVLAENGCIAIEHPDKVGDLVCLVFESQEAHDRFLTYWILIGDTENV